jgi:hypothetical protein
MQRTHRTWISLMAALGMLALAFAFWTINPAHRAVLEVDTEHKQHAFCAGTATSFYLADVKPRLSGVTPGGATSVTQADSPRHKESFVNFHRQKLATQPSPPLWLLNRALLI